MNDPIAARLALLHKLTKADLHNLWKELFQKAQPARLRRDLMIPILSYRLQELSFGLLSTDARRRLSRIACAVEIDGNADIVSSPSIKTGTRLVRQWQGKVHVVHVEEKGYEYQGLSYLSLSEIARLITGTRWSGPLFFGLKSNRSTNSKEAA
jgi:hypothetical protein